MKKTVLAVLGLFACYAPVAASAEASSGRVRSVDIASPWDETQKKTLEDLLDAASGGGLNAYAVAARENHGYDLPKDGKGFAANFLKLPFDDTSRTVIFVWVQSEGKIHLISSPDLDTSLTPVVRKHILARKVMPELYSGRSFQAMVAGLESVEQAVEGRYVLSPAPQVGTVKKYGKYQLILMALCGFLFIVGAIVGVVKFFRMDTSGVGYSGDPMKKLNDRYRRDHPPVSDPWD